MKNEDSSATSDTKNPWVIVSFLLGLLTGILGILTGMNYFVAAWPARGPVGVMGIFMVAMSLLTILGSLIVLLSKRVRVVGAIMVLIFGIVTNTQGIYSATVFVQRLLVSVISFALALYAVLYNKSARRTDVS